MSSLAIDRCNLVIVGAWNPAIVTPIWLKEQFPELIKENEFQASFTPGPMPSVHFIIDGLRIDPNSGRLRLKPAKGESSRLELIPKLARAIFNRLPHTPTTAVGCNLVYRIDEEEMPGVIRFVDYPGQEKFYAALDLHQIPSRYVRHSFALPECQLNLIYNLKKDAETMEFNFHHHATEPSSVRAAIDAFSSYLDMSQRLQEKLVERAL